LAAEKNIIEMKKLKAAAFRKSAEKQPGWYLDESMIRALQLINIKVNENDLYKLSYLYNCPTIYN
jgi:hypothetical protein